MRVSGRTQLVFLAGDPIGHTRGYDEYREALAAAGIDAAYVPAHVERGGLGSFLAGLARVRNVAGVVATVPHKVEALAAGRPDAVARRAGSANVLRPGPEVWECTQVDGTGFRIAAEAAGIGMAGKRVQITGAGGAGRAVAMAVAEAAPALLRIEDPASSRRDSLASDVREHFAGVPVETGVGASDVLVNCSTVGMGADKAMPLAEEFIPVGGSVYDIVNRRDTPLLVAARTKGCVVDDGRSMMLAEIPLILAACRIEGTQPVLSCLESLDGELHRV